MESLEDLPRIVAEAFAIANSGRPGPVLIDIPKDIQLQQADLAPFLMPVEQDLPIQSHEVAEARELLKQSQKPMLYIGGGVGMSGAVAELRRFIDYTGIPSVTTLKGLGAVAPSEPYYLGMLGMHGTKAANFAVQRCDLLIAVGARFDDRVTGKLNTFAPNAKVIHIDIDHVELDKLRETHVALLGDAKALLPELMMEKTISSWQEEVRQLKHEFSWRYDHPGDAIYAPLLLKQLSDRMKANTVITTDVGQHQMWSAQHIAVDAPEDFITSSGLGTMGFGIPAAIGAQVARPEDTVVCVSGDGSFMMNVQELGTIKRKQLPVKILLLDNQRLGMVRQWQELFFEQRYSETILTDNPDFVALARAFDIPGRRITSKSEVDAALDELLNSEGAYLLQVSINELENVWPLVPPGASNEKMMEKPL